MATAYYTADDGTAYFCGCTGPHLFAVDTNGKTLKRIEFFDEGYAQAYRIFEAEGNIWVCLDWGPGKKFNEEFYDLQYSDNGYFEEYSDYIADFYFIVDSKDYSYCMRS